MKKFLKWLAAALTACLLGTSANAAEVTVSVDDTTVPAFAEEGVTYVQLSALLEALGGWSSYWDQDSQMVTAQTDLFTLDVLPQRSYVLADGFAYGLNRGTQVRSERTYVPLRSLANLLGAEVEFVDWDTPVMVSISQPEAWSDDDLYWLSRIISAESRGEPLEGQIAVGNVVLNRVESEEFPDAIPDVIFDQKDGVQFEPVENGTVYADPAENSVEAAMRVLNGEEALEGAMFFYAPALSPGTWINENRTYLTTIGCHRFYS